MARVLVVDNFPDALFALTALLEHSGHDVRSAGDYQRALELCNGFDPEFALIELVMPGMDGYQIAAHLRDRCGAQLRLIAATGAHPLKWRYDGTFELYLLKPIDWEQLRQIIAP